MWVFDILHRAAREPLEFGLTNIIKMEAEVTTRLINSFDNLCVRIVRAIFLLIPKEFLCDRPALLCIFLD